MADPIPKITVGDYLVVLQEAHAALDAIEKKCLKDRPVEELLTEKDWTCIKGTYAGVIQEKGKPPMSGPEC